MGTPTVIVAKLKLAEIRAKRVCPTPKLIVLMFVATLAFKMDLGKMVFIQEFIEI